MKVYIIETSGLQAALKTILGYGQTSYCQSVGWKINDGPQSSRLNSKTKALFPVLVVSTSEFALLEVEKNSTTSLLLYFSSKFSGVCTWGSNFILYHIPP